ncbi:hypothetical protein F4V89_23050 [Neorhizobium galegae]|nr:hypothetical protein F4V89_23050 [Neorhizobium galegae]
MAVEEAVETVAWFFKAYNREIVSALMGGIVALFTTLYFFRMEAGQRKKELQDEEVRTERDRLAKHVDELAGCLEGMAASFDRREIPHADGRAFNGLYVQLLELFQPYIDARSRVDLGQLNYMIGRAAELDRSLYSVADPSSLPPEALEEMKRWSRDARRLQGDLKIAAANIRSSNDAVFNLTLASSIRCDNTGSH